MKKLLAVVLAAGLGSFAHAASDPLEAHARRFVMLATALGHLKPKEVDAFWGPPDLDRRNKAPAPSLAGLRQNLIRLRGDVARDPPSPRRDRLAARLDHLIARLAMMENPRVQDFDRQARQIYGVVAPPPDGKAQARALAALNRLLPGHGDVAARLAAWRARFVIPEARRKAVFLRALTECRARTQVHWPLPPDEKIDVIWGVDVPAAWHRYQGHGRSRLEINPAAVADPGAALDVACHEAYPGHHAQFVMMEQDAGADGLPVEDTLVLLHSPEQVLREGAANYGIELAFPPKARLAFIRDVLFPLAGFDRAQAAVFERVHRLVDGLSPSTLPILRDYYDGRLASGDALARLMLEAQVASPQSLMDFTRDEGAYVTGYAVARGMIGACVAARDPTKDPWAVLRSIVAGSDTAILAQGVDAAPCR